MYINVSNIARGTIISSQDRIIKKMYATLLLVQLADGVTLVFGKFRVRFPVRTVFKRFFFCGSSKPSKANAGTFPQTGHNRLIPNLFQ
jgi:hypothetical protein